MKTLLGQTLAASTPKILLYLALGGALVSGACQLDVNGDFVADENRRDASAAWACPEGYVCSAYPADGGAVDAERGPFGPGDIDCFADAGRSPDAGPGTPTYLDGGEMWVQDAAWNPDWYPDASPTWFQDAGPGTPTYLDGGEMWVQDAAWNPDWYPDASPTGSPEAGWNPDGGSSWTPDAGSSWTPGEGYSWEPDGGFWYLDGGNIGEPDGGWYPDGGSGWYPDAGWSADAGAALNILPLL